MNPIRHRWTLRSYAKNSDRLVSERVLPEIPPEQMRSLLGLPEDDPMFDCYPVTDRFVGILRGFGWQIEQNSVENFVEY